MGVSACLFVHVQAGVCKYLKGIIILPPTSAYTAHIYLILTFILPSGEDRCLFLHPVLNILQKHYCRLLSFSPCRIIRQICFVFSTTYLAAFRQRRGIDLAARDSLWNNIYTATVIASWYVLTVINITSSLNRDHNINN